MNKSTFVTLIIFHLEVALLGGLCTTYESAQAK